MKKLIFSLLLACFFSLLGAEPKLENYLMNDLELQRLALEFQKSQLSSKKTAIENGINIELSSGTARFTFSDEGNSVSISPSVKFSAPQASNLSLSASSSIKITDGENNSSDTSISMGIDLVSSSMLNRKIALKKSERSELEVKRAFQNRALEAEKEFYTELKNLFSSASSIVSKQKDLYDDSISLDEIKAKGYSKSSSKYRQAEMKVHSDKHEVETLIKTLEHDCAVFAAKCGIEFESGSNPKDFLPSEILESRPVDILSFKKSDYIKIENANYAHDLAELERKADRDFTLTANGGYTLKNSNTSFTSSTTTENGKTTTVSSEKSDTVDVGLNASWKGISLGAGVNIPLNSETNPVYSVSATLKPNTFRTRKIEKKTSLLTEEQEMIAIQSAEEDYETNVVDKQTELESILWSKKTNSETFALWEELETDEKKWFDAGIVKESEYLNAFANKELYRLKMLINNIELIIYNASTKLLFCRDYEFNAVK